MKKQITLIFAFSVTACVNGNQTTRGYQAIDLGHVEKSLGETSLLVQQLSNLCLNDLTTAENFIEKARSTEWQTASRKTLNKENLGKLQKTTLKIPGGGAPVEESQTILTQSFEDETIILEISERFDHKRLTSTSCTLYGKQDEFLKNCAQLGKLVKRAPDQNTKYEESKAHFIGWNASLSGKQSKIKCQHTPQSPTLPYEGTQLSVSINHITPIIRATKSSQPQSGASER